MFVTTVSIKTRLSRGKVSGFFRGLPAILSGHAPDPHGIRDTFLAAFIKSMFQSIHTAYVAKSKGGTDDLGNSWKELKPSTVRYRQLDRTQARYPLASKLWIMRLGERLIASLKPGSIVGGHYRPPNEDQIIEVEGSTLIFGTGVPYASRQNSLRPLIPNRIKPWVDKAMDEGIIAMSKKIANLVQSNKL